MAPKITPAQQKEKDLDKAASLVSDAQSKEDDAFSLLKKYMTPDEKLMHDGADIADELRGAIVTLAGVDTNLMEMSEELSK